MQREAVNEAVEEAGTAPMASPSEARREKEKDSAEGEMAQAGITQTDQKADQDTGTSDLEDKTEAKSGGRGNRGRNGGNQNQGTRGRGSRSHYR